MIQKNIVIKKYTGGHRSILSSIGYENWAVNGLLLLKITGVPLEIYCQGGGGGGGASGQQMLSLILISRMAVFRF